ncbi:MAG: hypothetical protein HYY25_13215 [Candidatus Wallbacteria bacterium]|nr:hypothetical protein [Candidatus Wallbacteria bacterium]
MKKMVLTLALAGALLPQAHAIRAQAISEDDFDDHGTGLVLRPMDGIGDIDGPSGVIPKAPPLPRVQPAPRQAPEPPAAKPPPAKVSGKKLVQPEGKKFHGKKSVTRIELAVILDRYLDYIKQQKTEIESKLERIPMQKGLSGDAVSKLDQLLEDLNGLSTEQGRLAKMVQELSGQVHEQGVDIQKLKITDMVTERRIERLENATGLAKHANADQPATAEEASQAEKLMDRVQRLEDMLYQSLSQLAETTTRLETLEDPKAPKTAAKPAQADAHRQARIPFAAAGGITIGAERQAYRKKLLARVKESLADLKASGPDGEVAAEAQPRSDENAEAPQVVEIGSGAEAPAAADDAQVAPAPETAAESTTDELASEEGEEGSGESLPELIEQAKGGN